MAVAVEDLKEFSVSWSSLRYWEECRQLQYLISQKKKNPIVDVRNFFHGNVVDRIMRNWLYLDNPEPGMMAGMVDEYMEKCEQEAKDNEDGRVKWKHKDDRQYVRDFCVDLVNKLEPILVEEVLPYEYEPAKRFAVPVKATTMDGEPYRLILRGEFDLLVRNQHTNQFRVWDLKATKDNGYWRKTMGQLVFYELSVFAMFQSFPELSGLIQPMCDEEVKRFTFTDDDRSAMWARIMRMMEARWKGDYAPKESSTGCSFCVVRHACSKFAPVVNKEGKNVMSFGGRKCDA